MTRLDASVPVLVVCAALAACGGGSSNSVGSTPPPSNGGTTPVNPCSTALEADQASIGAMGVVAGGLERPVSNKGGFVDVDPRGQELAALWRHQAGQQQRARNAAPASAEVPQPSVTSPAPVSEDVGDIAVIPDQGDLVLPVNQFDLSSVGLRFTRSGSNGYSVTTIDKSFRSTLGNRVTLADDDSTQQNVPFLFSFYGTSQTIAFVNSDGNITFGEADHASTDRDVARLVSGPPRVAPFLADLDPSAGGKVFVNAATDQYTVTWCGVHGFDSPRGVTAQVTLLPDGSIEFKYDSVTLSDAVVGLSPGRTTAFTTMDLSQTNPASGNGALGERFAGSTTFDEVAATKKFYVSHPDNFDQILFWTDQRLTTGGTFSFEINVANEIRGIGQDIYDLSQQYGSTGRLRSVVMMDALTKFPDDPTQKFLGENNTLSVMGQEVGHRWLAYIYFRDHTGTRSDALLGRDLAHWSFFFDSDASVMEGNDIQDLGGGRFQTVDAVKRYSLLDQYVMGAVGPTAVPPFFYVEAPASSHVREDPPQIGVSFTGTRRDVLIDDVIAINGARSPSAADTSKVHRQAFVYVPTAGHAAAPDQIAKLDNIRRQWEAFFRQATDGRMTAVTSLR